MSKVRVLSEKNKYRLSKERYLTALHYALQYPEWMDEYRKLERGISAAGRNPTESQAVELAELERKIRMIRETVTAADRILAPWLILGVTENRPFAYLKNVRGIPCERDMYYNRRRKFYWLLSKQI